MLHKTIEVCETDHLRAAIALPSPTKDAWLDVYQHTLRESIAACSEGAKAAELSQTSRSQVSSSLYAKDSGQNSSGSSAEQIVSSGPFSRQSSSTAEAQHKNNEKLSNPPTSINRRATSEIERAIDGSDGVTAVACPDRSLNSVPDAAYDGYIPDLPGLAPYQYEYIDGMELEANLSRQLLDGEMWQNDHFMTDISVQPTFWYSGPINNLGCDDGVDRRPANADLNGRVELRF